MGKFLNLIYLKSPLFIQNLFINIYGFKRELNRHGGQFKKYVTFLEKTQYYSKEQLNDLQLNLLKDFLIHCYNNVPYYHNLFNEYKFDPQKITKIDEIKILPILTKEILRKNINLLVARNYKKKDLLEFHTSGTTGKSLRVFYTKDCFRRHQAFLERQRRWAGVKAGDKVATFTGRIIVSDSKTKIFWRYNFWGKQLYFSTYHLHQENIKYYVDKLEEFNPKIIEGYPSAIYLISKWLKENNYHHKIHPKAILTTGETLLDYQKELIEDVFKIRTYNYYSSSEGAPFISQCEKGNYHLNIESGIFEILDENGNEIHEENKIGQLVVTSFDTKGTPLVRYAIGDSVITSNDSCSCGRNLPLVKKIIGRIDDMLYTKERGYIGRLSPAIKAFPNSVVQVQLVQNSIDTIDLYIVPDKETFKDEHLRQVIKEIKNRTGNSIQIKTHLVDQIPAGPNNKFRLTIRNFNPE